MSNRTLIISLSLILGLSVLSACSDDVEKSTSAVLSVTEEGSTSIDAELLEEELDTFDKEELSQVEIDGILFMREEEKLAHDVYIQLFDVWNLQIFSNIADSESSHTEAVRVLMANYGLSDPAMGNEVGEFVNDELQQLHNELMSEGQSSLVDGLIVGAVIEEVDLIDIAEQVTFVEGNEDIIYLYENLMKGSRNHLRAFVKTLEKQGVSYSPRYLEQGLFDAVINSDYETGAG